MTTHHTADPRPNPTASARERLLALRRRERAALASDPPPVEPRGGTSAPASRAQQALWFVEQLSGPGSAYNTVLAVRLRGPLQRDALRDAWRALVDRQAALRTCLPSVGDSPEQRLVPLDALALQDAALPEADGDDAALRRALAAHAATPFDLERGPLARATLFELAPAHHVLSIVVHHAVVDGWSRNLMARELAALYAARVAGAGHEAPLSPLAVSYADYAHWQREREAGPAVARSIDWWRDRLADLEPAAVPGDRTPSDAPVRPAAVVRFEVPVATTRALRALAAGENATLFMVLLAAFDVLLMRWSGRTDVAVGTPVAGRPRPELEPLVGYFANMLVLRTDLSGDPRFRELVARTRGTTLEALEHQEAPFDLVLAAARPQRDATAGASALFGASFALQNVPPGTLSLPGLECEPVPVDASASKFDLSVAMHDAGDTLRGELEYTRDRYEASTAARLVAQFGRLLDAVAADPDTPLGALATVDDAERTRLLVEFNDTAAPYPDDRCLHDLVAAQARATPDATAVLFGEQRLTYAALDAAADRMAGRMRALGAGPGAIVAIAMSCSERMVVAMLAAMKAGAAYLPLDPGQPLERLALTIDDASARVLVAAPGLAARLSAALREPAGHVDPDVETDDNTDDHTPADDRDPRSDAPAAGPRDLVYVIYTSGSTGRPKGVPIEHRSLLNNLAWQVREFGFGPADRVLQRSAVTFDASMWELWTPLVVGASLVIADEYERRDPAACLRLIERHGVTFTQFVPSFLSLVIAELEREPRELPLRLACVGGEALPGHDVRRWAAVARAELANTYGPTENTIDATFERLPREDVPATISIGRPMSNTRTLVLDPSRALTPLGGIGELYIGGVGLARGYLNRPELTAERFVPDPFRPGERLYRTGDLARQLPDGRLLFLGRIDHQVKLRGLRIELGEIEAALSACPGVSRSVALLRPDASGSPRIVAWAEAAGTDAQALRERLATTLPDYMVPSAIVVLDRLPELSSGKLDRSALPEPTTPAASEADDGPAPRTPTEAAVARVWAELLGLERLGADDDFFRRGGNSLLAARATARLRALLGIDLGLRATFESPTVSALAASIDAARGSAACDAPVASIPRVPEGVPVPLLPGQMSLAFIERLETANGAYNIPVAVALRGALDVPALEHALEALVARHPALRTRIDASGELPAQCVEPHAPIALERLSTTASALPAALRDEADRPFDLARAPLLRAVLFELGADEHVLLLAVHHIVADGWSMRVIATDLAELYHARTTRREPALPEMPLSQADWAAWRHGTDADGDAARHLPWWRERLGGLEPMRLPFDHPAEADAGLAGDHVVVTLPDEVATAVRSLARRASATPYMTLLAAFQVLLARWCGQTDVAVGTPLAGRDRVELEPAVGCFVRMLVLRTDLSGGPTFAQALGRVRTAAIESFARQDAPFDRLVAELRPQRERGTNPLFQATFTFDDDRPAVPMLAGLGCEPLTVRTPTAKFHLSLAIVERDGALHCTFEYRSALFSRATIEALAGRFATLLRGAVGTPDAPIGRLPLESSEALARLLALGRGADGPSPHGEGIAARVAAVARRMPDAVALVDGGRRLTYAELDACADRLARRLVALGTAPGEIVGLCVERSAAHVVAMLAILRSGAAYLPIDATLPIERAALMLDECATRRVVVDAQGAALAWPAAVRPVRLDPDADADVDADTQPFADTRTHAEMAADLHGTDGEIADACAADRVPDAFPDPGADALAYVIFTSGSTGRPKGVKVAQAGVLRLVLGTDYVALAPGRVVAQASTCAFDAATFEIWGALLNGATLAIVPRTTLLDADALAARLREDRIDTMFVTTALFNALVARRPALFASMDTVLFGGEAADGRTVRRVLEAGPPRRLLNVYGPTETTTFATWFDATAAWRADPSRVPARVPIGRPIAQTTCRVLDPFGALAPRGTVGELHVGGPGVAIGYLNRPELDAAAFVDDPFEPGARLYRTGDRVRWTDDDAIEFVGRVDDQVKIRGFRIEPGEIEAALRACDGVRDATVVVHEHAPGDRRLVAYVVAAAGVAPAVLAAPRLRAALRASLPEYMLPSAILAIAALPLNANGKVDRRALPDPAHALAAEAAVRRVTAAPRAADETETRLAALWCEVLDRAEVGPDDDFFELGGHSLLALRLLALVERRFGRTLPLAALFEAPTLRALAAALRDEAPATTTRSCVVPVQPQGRRAPLFFVSGWGGALLTFASLARELGPDQPLYVLDTAAFDAQEIRDATLPEIAARMVADLRAVCPSGPYRLCGFSLGGKFVHEIARQLIAAGEEVPLLALMDADAPGYPRRRALPARLALHLRELVRLGPVGAWHHLRERLAWYAAQRRGERERLFDDEVGDSAVARAMQASADAMLEVWHAFEPGRHAGRMLVIRAARRPLRPSVVDDDPALGWGRLVDGGLDLRVLDCAHRQMLDAAQAPALARILEDFLAAPAPTPDAAVDRRASATQEA
jgi:amino acid adenylation domain-containing protein